MPRPETPPIAADIIIELTDRPERPIVFIERKNPPYGWALPGGFVDVGETVEAGAIREAREETGLDVTLKGLLGCYSRPDRDPRGQTVSLVYVAEAQGNPVAQDDARDLTIATVNDFCQSLVFDHQKIIQDYQRLNPGGLFTHINLG